MYFKTQGSTPIFDAYKWGEDEASTAFKRSIIHLTHCDATGIYWKPMENKTCPTPVQSEDKRLTPEQYNNNSTELFFFTTLIPHDNFNF